MSHPLMKPFLCLLFSTLALSLGTAAEPPPAPQTITLADGRVLQGATLIAHRTEDVTIRHKGGVAVLRYEHLPAHLRAEAEKKRPGGPRYHAGETAAKKKTITGQIFVQTRGSGPYKFGNAIVRAFPVDYLAQWQFVSRPIRLPVPLAETTTDGDGRFTLNLPEGVAFFIYARGSRLMPDGGYERLEWRVSSSEIKHPEAVLLSNENLHHGHTSIDVEQRP